MIDRDLLNEFAQTANDAAFEKLVERYAGLVFGVAMRRTGDRQLAEEVSQNVFLILSRKAQQLREQPEKLPGWLHRTTVLESRNVRRKEVRRRDKLTALIDHEEAADQERQSRMASASSQEIHGILDEAIDALPAADRDIVLLRFFEGHQYNEVSRALGKSADACQKQVTRALEKLSLFMRQRGVALSTSALVSALSADLAKGAPALVSQSISTGILTGTQTITKTQLMMLTFQTMTYSKAAPPPSP